MVDIWNGLSEEIMMSLLRLRDSRDFSPYSSSAECADKDKTSSFAMSKADVEGPAVAGLARLNGLKKGYGGRASCRTVGSGCGRATCSRVGRCDRDGTSDWFEERVDGGLFGFSCFSS
ncbi:hypothetical protein E2C01_023324 [Portunus trituberculatus]|uniref:Uncharacterized protein n=1 Tax=Portunus trituberculatus TaxID=210409 RepID=A0A5B7E7Q1_PORTR|nr:hypothetical protein [Portunus trituberculatus]